MTRLTPKLITAFKEGYSLSLFGKDLAAGVIVGVLSVPLSLAFAIASGARPEQGLYTALIAGLLGGLLAGSRYQISGPTGAFTALVLATIGTYGYTGMLIATLMAGVFLIAMGLGKLGNAVRFIPYPVIMGFTSGIALLIFSSQVADFLGLQGEAIPPHFVGRWAAIVQQVIATNPIALMMGLASLALLAYWPRGWKWLPSPLVVMVLMTAISWALELPIATVGSRFGTLPNMLPSFSWPEFAWQDLPPLVEPAIAIALLAGIEALLSAVVADGMTGYKHRSDMELISQGVCNIGSALIGGLPVTGALARTATNIKAGGKTPIAAIVHAVVIVGVLLALGVFIEAVPLPALAAILMVVAYNMSEWRLFLKLLRHPAGDVAVLLVTFLLTLFVGLVTAIEAGIVLAALLFVHRSSLSSKAKAIHSALSEEEDEAFVQTLQKRDLPNGVMVFELYGPLFFAVAEKFKEALSSIHQEPKVLVFQMRHMTSIDATGLRAFENLLEEAALKGTSVLLAEVCPPVRRALKKAGILTPLHAHCRLGQALDHAVDIYQGKSVV